MWDKTLAISTRQDQGRIIKLGHLHTSLMWWLRSSQARVSWGKSIKNQFLSINITPMKMELQNIRPRLPQIGAILICLHRNLQAWSVETTLPARIKTKKTLTISRNSWWRSPEEREATRRLLATITPRLNRSTNMVSKSPLPTWRRQNNYITKSHQILRQRTLLMAIDPIRKV